MSNISGLRSSADYLLGQKSYDKAFYIYEEIYNQLWSALGSVNSGMSSFSSVYLSQNIKSSIEFKNAFIGNVANTIFIKWFNLDLDQALNEFMFTVYGHLQCICYSDTLHEKCSVENVFNEFLMLQNLVLYGVEDKWVSQILRIASPMIEDNRIRKVRPLLTDSSTSKYLVEGATKVKDTDWYGINISILDYLVKIGKQNSDLFRQMKNIVGPYSSNYGRRQHHNKKQEKSENKYNNYEKYEKYEKYERYEKYEKKTAEEKREFEPKHATEFEKAKYYGAILGLEGKLTKIQIRKKYYESIAKYHPDKVQDLGEELKTLAEKKTKEINAAFEWLKQKHNIT
jgi:hypothetical protein